jgi:hypothetical protein
MVALVGRSSNPTGCPFCQNNCLGCLWGLVDFMYCSCIVVKIMKVFSTKYNVHCSSNLIDALFYCATVLGRRALPFFRGGNP